MLIPGTTFSDNYEPYDDYRELRRPIINFLLHTKGITQRDLEQNHSEDLLFKNTVEELGEYAAAKTVENGIKKKELKESALIESVDLIICSLSLFFANGGTLEQLAEIGERKLIKWSERLK